MVGWVMLKPLETNYRGRQIVLECTHKKSFPPPRMYGATDEDVDNLWRQGRIHPTEYQYLQTWQTHCHLMMMGPRCLDCPLALKQNPRPGRPTAVDLEPWLPAKERLRWEDMKAGSSSPDEVPDEVPTVPDEDFPGSMLADEQDTKPSAEEPMISETLLDVIDALTDEE